MKETIILLFFGCLFNLFSCNSGPGKFNDNLMENLNRADREYTNFYALVEQHPDTSDFVLIIKKGKFASKEMEKLINEINQHEVPKDGADLKNLCEEYIKNMITSIKRFTSEKKLTKDQFEKALENMDRNEDKLNEINRKIVETQKSFADKSGFGLKDSSSNQR
jgi:SpoVK/Ycf46/Vps4 family AAA+-type ATPase